MAKKPGVRLTGGRFGGRVLEVPKSARPTEGRLREALFSIWGPGLADATVLDLFAGSGAVGLEAVGRGAFEVLAVEADPQAVAALERNARLLGADCLRWRRLRLPAGLEQLAREGLRFDRVFADPPYGFEELESLLQALPDLLAADGEVVLEHSSRRAVPLELEALPPEPEQPLEPSLAPEQLPEVRRPRGVRRLVRIDQRRYGESCLSFYRLGPA